MWDPTYEGLIAGALQFVVIASGVPLAMTDNLEEAVELFELYCLDSEEDEIVLFDTQTWQPVRTRS